MTVWRCINLIIIIGGSSSSSSSLEDFMLDYTIGPVKVTKETLVE